MLCDVCIFCASERMCNAQDQDFSCSSFDSLSCCHPCLHNHNHTHTLISALRHTCPGEAHCTKLTPCLQSGQSDSRDWRRWESVLRGTGRLDNRTATGRRHRREQLAAWRANRKALHTPQRLHASSSACALFILGLYPIPQPLSFILILCILYLYPHHLCPLSSAIALFVRCLYPITSISISSTSASTPFTQCLCVSVPLLWLSAPLYASMPLHLSAPST